MIERVTAVADLKPFKSVLDHGDVHVWCMDIAAEIDQGDVQRAARVISDDEYERATGLRATRDREIFILRRATLRQLIGRYLDLPAQSVELSYGEYRKPQLAQSMDGEGLMFNASWSAGRAVFAFSRYDPVGIDIEAARFDVDLEDLVDRICSDNEVDRFRAFASADRRHAFYLMWTVKEACVKALGCGVNMALDRLDVILPSERPPHFPGPVSVLVDGKPWSAFSLPFGLGFSGALAVSGKSAKAPVIGYVRPAVLPFDCHRISQNGTFGEEFPLITSDTAGATLAIQQ